MVDCYSKSTQGEESPLCLQYFEFNYSNVRFSNSL